jgi:hypothetical protein
METRAGFGAQYVRWHDNVDIAMDTGLGDATAMIKTLSAPFRMALRFPLVQFALVIALILLLQAADDKSAFGMIFNGLDRLVEDTVELFAAVFTVKSFTRSWLTFGFMIAYVYLACWLILSLGAAAIRRLIDLAGRHNLFWSRNAIARQRGIAAYRAWLPFESIRPAHVSQRYWEEEFAWPPDNRPPYPPLRQRLLRAGLLQAMAIAIVLVVLQVFTPFPVVSWLGSAVARLVGRGPG